MFQLQIMVIGADVTHPSPDQMGIKPSIAAIVASYDPAVRYDFNDFYRVWRENLYTPIIYFVNSCCMNTTETCNTAIEREFCGLSEDYFENCEKLSYEA